MSTAPTTMLTHHVPIVPHGDRRAIHIVHGAGGNVLFLWSLARAMAGSRPIYGFQAHGIDGTDMPDATVEVMAARYVSELREHGPGPYLLGGYSGGGLVALEMAAQLQATGDRVDCVVLFDSVPGGRAFPSRLARWRHVTGHVRRSGLAPVRPYVRQTAADMFHRVVPVRAERAAQIENEERLLGAVDSGSLGFVNLFHYFSATAEAYRPGTYDVDAILLKGDIVWPAHPYDYYWTPHIRGTLTVRSVPGDHNSMFFPENAPRLADVLSPLLDVYDDDVPPVVES